MYNSRVKIAALAISLVALSCNAPSGQEIESLALTLTALVNTAAASPPGATLAPAATTAPGATTAPLATACTPLVTANLNANVRKGPSTDYDAVGSLLTNESAPIVGRNAEGSWWNIVFPAGPGGKAWIANSTVTASCLPASVAVMAAPPPPSGTCKDGYVWRLIKPSDKICVPPSSKAQADADNAAAASRLCTATYGADTCAEGYVWREAFSNDHVCVSPATRSQAAADNAAAASRWIVGPYGPHTCIDGFVWREATGSTDDDVCVTPDIRTQAAADNAAAASRLCTATYGPDTCAAGYVWREAFSNDHVCVAPDVRTQTANDNASASSHTWP
jgi:uncharacterized protein YraI